ncbi:hypothetical protein [Desulfotomaculum defluvii]
MKIPKKPYKFLPKSKFVRWVILIFIMWLLVTTYFYFQHYRIDKVIYIDEEVHSGDNLIKLKELRLSNYKVNYPANFEAPWYFLLANNFPQPVRELFVKICYFYTSPYEFSHDVGTLSLRGYVISPKGSFSIEDFSNVTDIWLSGPHEVGYLGGHQIHSNSPNNDFHLIKIYGENAPLGLKEISIMIDDKKGHKKNKITLQPKWEKETYTFFDRNKNYSFDPEDTVTSFLNLVRDNHISQAKDYVMPEKQASIQWELLKHKYVAYPRGSSTSYAGNHFGYQNVISENFVYGEMKADDFKDIAEQQLFLVDTKHGWKIIQVSPLRLLQ